MKEKTVQYKDESGEQVEETLYPNIEFTYPVKVAYNPIIWGAEVNGTKLGFSQETGKQNGKDREYLLIMGDAETLPETVSFNFSDTTASVVYTPNETSGFQTTEGACVGTVTVTTAGGDAKAEYPVVYRQDVQDVPGIVLNGLTEEGNYINSYSNYRFSDGKNPRKYWIVQGAC